MLETAVGADGAFTFGHLPKGSYLVSLFPTPPGMASWDFFDRLLAEAQVVGAPGSGFGPSGEGYFRLTAFGSREQTEEAVERICSRVRMRP